MVLEIFVAVCMYNDTKATKMVCRPNHSVWIKTESVEKFYPDPSNHYIGDTCFVHHKDGYRTLMAESCESFRKRFEK